MIKTIESMKKATLTPKTIDEDIIKDILCSVGTLDDKIYTRDQYFLVGGIGVQGYLPTSCRRPTSDVDLAIMKPMNYEEFKLFSRLPFEYLNDLGYSVKTKKRSRVYSLDISNNEDSCILEFSRRNPENYKGMRKILERELENSRKKIVEERDSTYRVCSPEDLVVPKLMRSIHAMNRDYNLGTELSELSNLSERTIKSRLKKIGELRRELQENPLSYETMEELRFISDTYDIRVLSELVGFNEAYLNIAAKDWDVITFPSNSRDFLIRNLLPIINL